MKVGESFLIECLYWNDGRGVRKSREGQLPKTKDVIKQHGD